MQVEKTIQQEAFEALQDCTVDGNLIKLPSYHIDTAVYDVMKVWLVAAGGTANTKKKGFSFDSNADTQEILSMVIKENTPGDAIDSDEDDMEDEHLHETSNDEDQEVEKEKELVPRKEKRTLRYDFTAVEAHDLAIQLATETKKLAAIEEEKSSVTSQFTAKIKESKATINKVSNLVANGYEYRDVEVEIMYHKPEPNKKTITRKDTGHSWVEKMESWEFNLFNQPKEEEEESYVEEDV